VAEAQWSETTGLGSVTVEGYAHIAESRANVDRAQAFVAMWFNEEIADGYEQGIRLAITDTGYTPMRIDRKEHINKIDDEIIAEIRRSRFLVADFSQGDDGARGGVYFEAGFAYGLDIPAIYTCRKSDIEKLHFDTRQYNHTVWESPEELREALRNRILAVIGEGPTTLS
jgi:nucleoside 2-deoxyribosyltransferase